MCCNKPGGLGIDRGEGRATQATAEGQDGEDQADQEDEATNKIRAMMYIYLDDN